MTIWTRIGLCVLCLFISAPKFKAETIDHLNPRWQGAAWQANRLALPGMAYQGALYPLITQGPGSVTLPSGPFVLRLHVLPLTAEREEPLLIVWGRVEEAKSQPLATLFLRQGRLVWICPVNPRGDSLFDAAHDIELATKELAPRLWTTVDVLINPQPYQQTFGWNLELNHPEDPAKSAGKPLQLARQLSVAAWTLEKLEIPRLHSVWLGQMELLAPDTKPIQLRPNIIRK
jgi:hypothetical protein